MTPIISISQAKSLASKLHRENKKIVLAGGCFDILHLGHIRFLQKAKARGDVLIVMLESDERIKKDKGANRPVHSQLQRAEILTALKPVDYVIPLPLLDNNGYDILVKNLKPAIIATTLGDLAIEHKKRQSKLTGAKLIQVITQIPNKSTSSIAKNLYKEEL